MRALLAAAASLCLLGCNAVLGLEERSRATDAAEGEDSFSADSARVEDTNVVEPDDSGSALNDSTTLDTGGDLGRIEPDDDTGTVDTAPPTVDTGISKLPVSCSPACTASQKCYVIWSSSTDTYSTACAASFPIASAPLSKCFDAGMDQHVCGEGYACGYLYPGKMACFPLCSSSTSCASLSEAPYCNYRVSGDAVNRCGQCNPRGSGSECGLASKSRCMVANTVTPPSCTTFGIKAQGETCKSSTECKPGFACSCNTGSGGQAIGPECMDAGTCKELCATSCSSPVLKCLPVGTSGYSVCR